jgi:hypothetical protein
MLLMRLLALLCVIAAMVATSASASTGGKWATHRSTGGGFTVAAPSTWIDMTRLTPQVLAKTKTMPALQQYVDLLRTTKAIKLLLADVSITSLANQYASNLNVVQAPTVGDLKFMRDASVASLESTGVVEGTVHSAYMTLPAGKAAHLTYLARFKAATPEVALQQFMFVRAGKVTILTYTTLPKLRSAYAATIARSIHSFRFR